jgi:hypothetical protein
MKENFKQWAKELSGCDGGNIQADTWLCGIEWGGGYNNYQKLKKEIEDEVKTSNEYDFKEHQEYTNGNYGKSFAKLYTAIYNNECKTEKDLENYQNYIETLDNDKIFKLNLYPISFKDTNRERWDSNDLEEITGFKSKYLYQLWCFFNRFPNFLKLRKEHKPKLIICTGVDYLRDFLMCFAGCENIGEVQVGYLEGQSDANKYERNYYHLKIENTLIVILPFFSGSYGLNSYYLLNEMGKRIKELLGN